MKNTNMKKLLVVEDNPKHLDDVRMFLDERVRMGAGIGVDYAHTLHQAMEHLHETDYDGVLSDVFFPSFDGEKERENGTLVGQYALDNGIPVILVTSTYHHGRYTEEANRWARARNMELVDKDVSGDTEAQSKNWDGAYVILTYLVEHLDSGVIKIAPEGLSDRIDHFILTIQEDYHKSGAGKGTWEDKVVHAAYNDPILKTSLEKYCQGMFKL